MGPEAAFAVKVRVGALGQITGFAHSVTLFSRGQTHKDWDSGRVPDAEEDELLILQGCVERAGKERQGPTPEDIYNNPWNSEDSPS